MKKILYLLLLSITFSSCVYYDYDCYVFEVEKKITYVPDAFGLPYRPPVYYYSDYSKCGLTPMGAKLEAKEKEYTYDYYSAGYYITETQTCRYWNY